MVESVYYRDTGRLPLASRLSLRARQKMFQLFMTVMRPGPDTRVLDVGVTSDQRFPESNFFERWYPHPERLTCVGTEDGAHLAARHPGLTYVPVAPHAPLPFADGTFDVVFSNAVVEHVGARAAQLAFVRELCRVGRAFFVTTPNRWFPVEHHTGLPFLHYLPAPLHRALLRRTRFRYWADEAHLNILTARRLAALFPPGVVPRLRAVRLAGVPTNIVAFGRSAR